ncbi:MAG: ATPase, partial [Bacteroidetes bacterium SW_11_45_7]
MCYLYTMLTRTKEQEIHEFLQEFPAVGIIGPRQCGKTTLAKQILNGHESSIYLDLENPDDKAQLQNPTLFFERNRDVLLCLDEIQLEPELLTNIRSIIDQR